jgi:hypothetical protein
MSVSLHLVELSLAKHRTKSKEISSKKKQGGAYVRQAENRQDVCVKRLDTLYTVCVREQDCAVR